MDQIFHLADRVLEPGATPLVVAEIGVNFGGDLDLAMRSIDAAAACGVDAVKFQTFRAEEFVADPDLTYTYATAAGPVTENAIAMFRRLELPAAWHGLLQARAAAHNLLFLSSCADTASADLLAGLGVPALKLASEDLINLPLLRHVAGLGRPVILSTGMAEPEEIAEALDILSGAEILLLHCVSLYPTPDGEANLRRIVSLRDTFGRPVGYSDHTLGIAAAAAATALGALMIEKHFTTDRSLPGPDHRLSADPAEMAALVATVRQVSRQSGTGALAPATAERKARQDFRRSIVASRDLPAGTVLETSMLVLKRPHTGLHPRELAGLLGRSTVRPLKVDQQLSRDDLAPEDLASEDLASEDLASEDLE